MTATNEPTIAKSSRILIVEDEMLISMLLEDLLTSYGYEIVGPAAKMLKAVGLALSEAIDGGILDLNVAGEEVYPVAEALAARHIPFLFVTGYRSSAVSEKYRNRLTLQKPFKPLELKEALRVMLLDASSSRSPQPQF